MLIHFLSIFKNSTLFELLAQPTFDEGTEKTDNDSDKTGDTAKESKGATVEELGENSQFNAVLLIALQENKFANGH